MSIHRWMDKEDEMMCAHTHTHTHTGLLKMRWCVCTHTHTDTHTHTHWTTEDEMIYVCTHTHTCTHTLEYYSVIKKSEKMPFAATWIDGPRDYTKWTKRKTNTIWNHLHVESKIWHKWSIIQNRNRLRDGEQICGSQGGAKVREGEMGSLGVADAN